jgi:hypothetical protein
LRSRRPQDNRADEPLITREELSQTLFAILDIGEDVARIKDILEEGTDGEVPEDDA